MSDRRMLRNRRNGITLVELMVAVLISLVILLVMVGAFRFASKEISEGRATIEMAGQLRSAGELLRSDLENATVPLRPNSLESSADGYFEYVEGFDTDAFEIVIGVNEALAAGIGNPAIAGASYLGDHDDILALTVRSEDHPFRGRWVDPMTGFPITVESYVAEVVWWVKHNDIDPDGTGVLVPDGEVQYAENLTLHRRVLLVRPDLAAAVYANMDAYFAANDIAARPTAGGGIVMNSLSDLTRRENRFSHNGGTFPHEIDPFLLYNRNLTGVRQGEDVMLTSVAAFDVKVFSPDCEVDAGHVSEQIIDPADPGFIVGAATNTNEGAYVDLGFASPVTAWFGGNPDPNSQLDTIVDANGNPVRTWCTWSPHYEYDGINQDSLDDAIIDQGTDGVDNDSQGGTDDDFERETKAPYPYPIRSLQITFRLIDKGTGQSRQLTVRQSFVPE